MQIKLIFAFINKNRGVHTDCHKVRQIQFIRNIHSSINILVPLFVSSLIYRVKHLGCVFEVVLR